MATKSARRFLMILGVLVVSILSTNFCVNSEPQVPCYFIFGDSLADNGNNNNLLTLARANYKPYGIDFPSGPTGRFCNGRTNVDILAELLGIEDAIPPFASISGHDILKGLNYASGAGGILAATAFQVGDRISLDRQLRNHQVTITSIAETLGSQQSADQYLNKCLYSVGMGSNDYINNYFMPQLYLTSVLYTPEKYATLLIQEYSRQILTLYKYGARKVALIGLGPLGCTPQAISTSDTNGSSCVDKFNSAAQIFNQKLISLVDLLNTNLTSARFVYMNTFGMAQGDPAAAGFKVVNVGCCPVNSFGQCIANQTPCPNRSEYMFWDGFHPTEAANLITAPRMYAAVDPSDTYPMDISHLVQLKL